MSFGGVLRPEELNFKAEGRQHGGVLGKGAASTLPLARGSGAVL